MRYDTQLAGLEDAADHARRLEALGVDGAFTFEGPHDVFTPLVLAAGASTTLELATNVAIAFPRNPVQLAHQAWDLQLLSKGRFTLGLGSQIRAQVVKRYGAEFDRPIARMRELVGALRAIFATWETGERLDFRGEFSSHTLMPPMFNPGPHPFGLPPIALGGLGPQMVSLAAEVADGLLVMPFNTGAHLRQRTMPAVAEGLARGGRSRSDLTVTGEVIVCCGRDEAELETARVAGRWLLSFYASTPAYRPVLEVEGWEDLQPELNALSKSGRWDEMPERIDDTMLATLAAVGSPAEVAAEIVDRFGGLVDRVGFYTPYLVADETLAALVDALAHADPRSDPGDGHPHRDPHRTPGAAVTDPTPTYDEFSLFHENAEEAGLPFDDPPVVRRESLEVAPGRKVSALVWGDAPPELVLIHGGGQNAHTWDTVALALDRPLLAVDLPGHGHSDWPQESAWLDPSTMADDVAKVIGRTGAGRPGRGRHVAGRRHRHRARHPSSPPRPPPAPGRHHTGGERRQDVRHRRLPVGSRDVRHVRRDPASAPSSSIPPGRCPHSDAACSTTRSSCPTAPGPGATRSADRRPTPASTSSGPSSGPCGTRSRPFPCPCCWPGAAGRRWWTTTTSPSSTVAGPTMRWSSSKMPGTASKATSRWNWRPSSNGFVAGG